MLGVKENYEHTHHNLDCRFCRSSDLGEIQSPVVKQCSGTVKICERYGIKESYIESTFNGVSKDLMKKVVECVRHISEQESLQSKCERY